MFDEVGPTGGFGGEHRNPAGHRFEIDVGKRLVDRRKHEQISGTVVTFDLLLASRKQNPVLDS